MMVTTLLIAVPTGIKVFSWLATMWEGRIHFTTPMLWAVGFVAMFLIGGLSGIYLGTVPIDVHASDTYYIVAHIHYVLYGGSVFTIIAGIYYWFPKMTGPHVLGAARQVALLADVHRLQCDVLPDALARPPGPAAPHRRLRRRSFEDWNLFISISAFVLGAAMLIFLYNMITSWVRGPHAPANPWRAHSIEWQVSSPPPLFNFDEIPQVVGGPYEYGVPGARHAVSGARTARRGRPEVPAEERRRRR